MTVSFAAPVPPPPFALHGVTCVRATPTEWVLDVRGPIGPLRRARWPACRCATWSVDPFKLEDYIAQFYGG